MQTEFLRRRLRKEGLAAAGWTMQKNPVSDDAIPARVLLADVDGLDDSSNLFLEIVHPAHTRKPDGRRLVPSKLARSVRCPGSFASRSADDPPNRLPRLGGGARWRDGREGERGGRLDYDEVPIERTPKRTLQIYRSQPHRPHLCGASAGLRRLPRSTDYRSTSNGHELDPAMPAVRAIARCASASAGAIGDPIRRNHELLEFD